MESTLQGQLKAWRQHLHRYPETGFDEVKTSDFIATILTTLGLDVHRGIGGTGLVASLTVGNGKRAIGLRADVDALNIAESAPGRAHASLTPGSRRARAASWRARTISSSGSTDAARMLVNGDALCNGGVPLHNARYDFNDEILSIGARYFAELARLALPVA
ncbi:hypothetical protein WK18_02930 [Burkholderia ubonensis]|nr:hypothetical protein WK18_02930 [Burkholderia ubonensis]KWB74255.1 hypothetical protein WL41_16530 [Burkholderia ubonensis]KWC16737.1 hypothetical protein WL46_26805 [Burkholderia ubonensis]OJA22426.1 hypothetical protein BGX87_29815 [Burkholderia ubonensis]